MPWNKISLHSQMLVVKLYMQIVLPISSGQCITSSFFSLHISSFVYPSSFSISTVCSPSSVGVFVCFLLFMYTGDARCGISPSLGCLILITMLADSA
jgi:hypothetical protein